MPDRPDLRAVVAAAIRDRVRVHLGPKALAMAERGQPMMLNYGEAEDAAYAALDAVQAAYVPPPPGSDRDKLPGHLLAVVDIPPYLSTACQTADALTEAIPGHLDMADELAAWAERMHAQCRITHKFTMQPCACRCGHPGRAGSEETP